MKNTIVKKQPVKKIEKKEDIRKKLMGAFERVIKESKDPKGGVVFVFSKNDQVSMALSGITDIDVIRLFMPFVSKKGLMPILAHHVLSHYLNKLESACCGKKKKEQKKGNK